MFVGMLICGFSICEIFIKYNEVYFLILIYVFDFLFDLVNVMFFIFDMVKKIMKSEMLLER